MPNFYDILDTIKKVVKEHEEPYRDGAWEDFLNYKQKGEKRYLWPIYMVGLAASLLVGVFVFNYTTNYYRLDTKYKITKKVSPEKDSVENYDKREPEIINRPYNNGGTERERIVKNNQNLIGTEIRPITEDIINKKELEPIGTKSPVLPESKNENLIFADEYLLKSIPEDTIRSKETKQEVLLAGNIDFKTIYEKPGTKKETKIKLGFLVSPYS